MRVSKLVLDGRVPFDESLEQVKDPRAVARILTRIRRLELGNPGDHKALQGGLFELRVDVGAGWRIYYLHREEELVLLALVGNKKTQSRDIQKVLSWLN